MNNNIPKKFLLKLYNTYSTIRSVGKQKIFSIGLNKTGTTSLKKEMQLQGYIVGNQRQAELLFYDWVKKDFRRLIRYCKTAQFFQDVPFSYPYTFIAVHQAFPNSKFILTIRDNAEQWYNSLIEYHGKMWGNGNIPPTSEDLKNATYIYKGQPYQIIKLLHNVSDDNLYNKDILMDHYNTHNKHVIDYFRNIPDNLLVINIKEKDSYAQFCKFMDIEQKKETFPWENKT